MDLEPEEMAGVAVIGCAAAMLIGWLAGAVDGAVAGADSRELGCVELNAHEVQMLASGGVPLGMTVCPEPHGGD